MDLPCASCSLVSRSSSPRTSVTAVTPTSARACSSARAGSPLLVHTSRSDAPFGAWSSGATTGVDVEMLTRSGLWVTNTTAAATVATAATKPTNDRRRRPGRFGLGSSAATAGSG